MIVAAGLSPAWQQVIVVDGFQGGAVNRARQVFWCSSGKVLNVGVALHYLAGGCPANSLTLTILGGAAYDLIEREFDQMRAPRQWVHVQAPTRVCTTIVDCSTGTATELVENAGPITDAELTEFENAFAEVAATASVVVLTGSLPAGAPPDYYRRLLRHVRGSAILDFRGPELLAALDARPLLVKPNREELIHTLGKPIDTDNEMKLAIGELQRRGARAVLVTAGKDDAWLGVDGAFHRFKPATVAKPVNAIGCGDCLTAGLAWALEQGLELPAAVEQGMSCAAANLQTLLPGDFDGRREQRSVR